MNEAGYDYDALMADATRLSEASDSPRLHAQRAWRVIRGAEEGRTALRVLQVRVVAKVAREELWKHHPNNYPTLPEFLKAACGSSAHSVPNELNAVGALVLFCEEHHIDIDKYLDDQTWAKPREALPHCAGHVSRAMHPRSKQSSMIVKSTPGLTLASLGHR
jgi:hypothetical protein